MGRGDSTREGRGGAHRDGGGAAKVDACRKLGADVAVNYPKDDFVAVVKTETKQRGADVIFDPVGGGV